MAAVADWMDGCGAGDGWMDGGLLGALPRWPGRDGGRRWEKETGGRRGVARPDGDRLR